MSYPVSVPEPWWVNAAIIVPVITFFWWRRRKLDLSWRQLGLTILFAVGFAFIEASVVVYLRASVGQLVQPLFSLVVRCSNELQQIENLQALPVTLLGQERLRELATLVVILAVALLTAQRVKERVAVMLWITAWWGLLYYGFLYLLLGWPCSLTTPDVLFLVPTTWYAPLWFPLSVGLLLITAVLATRKPDAE